MPQPSKRDLTNRPRVGPPFFKRCAVPRLSPAASSLSQRLQPPTRVSATASEEDTTTGGVGGEVMGNSPSATAAVPRGERNHHKRGSNDGDGKGDPPKQTPVSPLLLLKGVPEAVMCQLVLTGWEQSM